MLSAGFGSRLKPITNYWPKCLMPIRGIPLLDYWIANCQNAGIDDILINSHWHSDVVEGFLARSIYVGLIKNLYEESLLGTAGTLKKNTDLFKGEALLVAHADNLLSVDIFDFLNFHLNERDKSCPISMMTFKTLEPHNCGVVSVNTNGIVTGFYEKTKESHGNIANGAVYIFENEVLEWIMQNDVSDISIQVIPNYIGRIATWQNFGAHIDIGTIENLRYAQNINITYIKKIKDSWMEWFEKSIIPKIKNDMESP